MSRRLAALAVVAGLFAATFVWVVRPWYLSWGATPAEQARALPGDDIIPNAATQQTRAITIDANVNSVWPWIAQIGQDRAGFYSYDLLENLVGCEMPVDDRPRADCQGWAIGDKLWMYPPSKAGGVGFATLRTLVPGRALGFAARAFGTPLWAPENGSWTFVLEPIDDTHTRVLVRGRASGSRAPVAAAFDRALFEPAHYVMERRMLLGVKALAESRSRGRIENHAQVALWTLTFGIFAAAAVLTVSRREWRWPLSALVASGVVFQILTFRQPPTVFGALLVAVCGALLTLASLRRVVPRDTRNALP